MSLSLLYTQIINVSLYAQNINVLFHSQHQYLSLFTLTSMSLSFSLTTSISLSLYTHINVSLLSLTTMSLSFSLTTSISLFIHSKRQSLSLFFHSQHNCLSLFSLITSLSHFTQQHTSLSSHYPLPPSPRPAHFFYQPAVAESTTGTTVSNTQTHKPTTQHRPVQESSQ